MCALHSLSSRKQAYLVPQFMENWKEPAGAEKGCERQAAGQGWMDGQTERSKSSGWSRVGLFNVGANKSSPPPPVAPIDLND